MSEFILRTSVFPQFRLHLFFYHANFLLSKRSSPGLQRLAGCDGSYPLAVQRRSIRYHCPAYGCTNLHANNSYMYEPSSFSMSSEASSRAERDAGISIKW